MARMIKKTVVSAVFVPIVILLASIYGATAQGDIEQFDSIFQLMQNRNQSVVTTCPRLSSARLSCVLENSSLIIENQVFLQNIDITVVACNSSLTLLFTLSNETMVEEDNLQCPTTIALGELMITFNLDVFIDYSTEMNFTKIDTSVYARQGGQDIELFARTNLTLSAQIPHEDCIASGGLILPPEIECSTVSPTTSPDVTDTSTRFTVSYFSMTMMFITLNLLWHFLTC